VIILSASANKLGKLKAHAATYASLIMEELDPDHNGYIEVSRDLLNFNQDRIELSSHHKGNFKYH